MRIPAILDRLHAAFDVMCTSNTKPGPKSKSTAAPANSRPLKKADAEKKTMNDADSPHAASDGEPADAGAGCLVYREDFAPATEDSVRTVHRPEYVEFLKNLDRAIEAATAVEHGGSTAGGGRIMSSPKVPLTPAVQRGLMQFQSPDVKTPENSDTMFTRGSLKAAYRAAGAVMAAVDGVIDGLHRRAFCAVRPPGHHAGSLGLLSDAVSCGFCVFNNVCVGAMHALARDPSLRVAIVDFDVHHGNGSEEIVSRWLKAFQMQEHEHEHHPPLWFGSIHLYHSSRKTPTLSVPPERPWQRPPASDVTVEPDAGQWQLEPCSPTFGGDGDDATTDTTDESSHKSKEDDRCAPAAATASDTAAGDDSVPHLSLQNFSEEQELEFYPGTGARDNLMLNIVNAPLPPLWGVRQTSGAGGRTSKKRKTSHTGAAARNDSTQAEYDLPPASAAGRVAFRHAVVTRLLPALRAYSPGLLLLSAGFDGAHFDQGNLRDMRPGLDLEPEDFLWLTEQLVAVANLTANGRVVSVLEGGYGKPEPEGGFERSLLATSCQAHVAGLAGVPFEPVE